MGLYLKNGVVPVDREVIEEIRKIRERARRTADFLKEHPASNRKTESIRQLLTEATEDIDALFITKNKTILKEEHYRDIYVKVKRTKWYRDLVARIKSLEIDFRVWPLEMVIFLLGAKIGQPVKELEKKEVIEIMEIIAETKL
ncbi:MAG: hypothetical protein M1355_03210 [Patescibacteria group bacterium]|nr:hypothetical protein [Patescibacteria group bacterium]